MKTLKILALLLTISPAWGTEYPQTHIGDEACSNYANNASITPVSFCMNYSETSVPGGIYQCTICGCGTFAINDPGMLEDRKICVNVSSQLKLLKVLKSQ